MTAIEERLTSALRARAEQVQPDDLRAPEVPRVTAPSPWRRPSTYALVAAACVAAVALPVALELAVDDGSGPEPRPAFTPTPDGEGWDWPVLQEIRADVDGDGTKDDVRLRRLEGGAVAPPARLEVTLAGGPTVHLVLRGEQAWFISGSVDADGGDGIVLDRSGAEALDLAPQVVSLVSGVLVAARAPAVPPLVSGVDADGRVLAHWIEDGHLRSFRSIGKPTATDETQQVDLWEWSLVDGALAPTSLGIHCVVLEDGLHRSGTPTPCEGSPPDPPLFYPGQAVPDSGELEATIDGRRGRVSLEGRTDAEEVAVGEVELVVRWDDGSQSRAPVRAGYRPYVAGLVTTGESEGILVIQQVGDSWAAATVFALVEGDLTTLPQPPDSEGAFGGTERDVGTTVTWLSQDGHLFSRYGDAASGSALTWEWTIVDGRLRGEELGRYCFDLTGSVPTWLRGDCS